MSPLSFTAGTRRRAAGAGVACILGALAATYASAEVGNEAAVAAVLGHLDVHPATGDTDTADVAFGTAAACPDGSTDFLVQVSGPGIPTDPIVNALGLNAIPNPAGKIDLYAMGNTWANVLSTQGVTLPYAGTVKLTLFCIGAGEMKGEYTADLTFTAAAGTKSTYAVAGAGGSPTPTPSGSASPTPTPTGGASPTPTPSTSASPSPTPAASTTPTPSATAGASPSPSTSASPTPTSTTTPSTTVSPTATVIPSALPKTGAASRPLLIVAAFLLVCGAFLLALSSTADPEARNL